MSKKILFLSEPLGMGHHQAANALMSAFKQIEPDVITEIISLSDLKPVIKKTINKAYFSILRFNPALWGIIYKNTKKERRLNSSKKIVNKIYRPVLTKIFKHFKPDIIICTHPFPCSIVSNMKKKGLNIPLAAVITDFDIHPFWLNDQVDIYLVANEQLKNEIIKYGVEPDKIYPTGIPIRPVFEQGNPDRSQLKASLGLTADKPVILVMGGGLGIGLNKLPKIISQLSAFAQVIVITGKNDIIKNKLSSLFNQNRNIKILGFIDNIHEYMEVSDILVTKPGGLTCAEALAKNLPLIIYKPIPGQEEFNSKFLQDQGVALQADNPDEICSHVEFLLNEPLNISSIKEKTRLLAKPASALEGAMVINNIIKRGTK